MQSYLTFHLPSDPVWRWCLLALLSLWAISLFGGFILGPTRANRRIPLRARMLSSLALTIAAWVWFAFTIKTNRPAASYALLIALGMSWGFLGDIFLARIITKKSTSSLLGGIGSFAVGHLFYIAGIILLARALQQKPGPLVAAVLLFWLIAVAAWWLLIMRGSPSPSLLHWATLPYALLLATTAGAALGLAWQQPLFYPLAAGAILFLSSDLILASSLFNDVELPLHHDIVWLTYGPGQMLIVYSIGAAVLAL